ncbi:MAG: RNA polymerase sigma factor [Coprobacillaceae bacterium]
MRLYLQIINKVYYWCFTILKNKAEAEDVAQETMVLIYRKIHTLKNPEYFNSWMYRIVTNCCYGHLKKRKDVEFIEDDDFVEGYESRFFEERRDYLPSEAYTLNETREVVIKLINKLPRKQQETIILYYLEEFKVDEIAQILGCSSNSVKASMHDGRKNLERQVIEYQDKNDVRLYNLAIFPILGLLLDEHRKKICADIHFKFNKDPFKLARYSNITSVLSSSMILIICSIVLLAVLSFQFLLHSNESGNDTNTQWMNQWGNENKLWGYQWIYSIDYDDNLTRDDVTIVITLQKEVSNKDIKVTCDNKEIDFEVDKEILTIIVKENGTYVLQIKNDVIDININNIDAMAPELIGVYKHKDHLELVINDEASKLNYQKSYIECNGRRYTIDQSLNIKGIFDGEIFVTLFTQEERTITYKID